MFFNHRFVFQNASFESKPDHPPDATTPAEAPEPLSPPYPGDIDADSTGPENKQKPIEKGELLESHMAQETVGRIIGRFLEGLEVFKLDTGKLPAQTNGQYGEVLKAFEEFAGVAKEYLSFAGIDVGQEYPRLSNGTLTERTQELARLKQDIENEIKAGKGALIASKSFLDSTPQLADFFGGRDVGSLDLSNEEDVRLILHPLPRAEIARKLGLPEDHIRWSKVLQTINSRPDALGSHD